MTVVGDFWDLTMPGQSVLTVGVFDGVHRGHRYLLEQVVERARVRRCLAIVVTLHPRPRGVLWPELQSLYLVSLEERVQMLAEIGFDYVAVLGFTRETSQTTAEVFVKTLRQRYGMVEIWADHQFALGYRAAGSIPALEELGKRLGFAVKIVAPFTVDGTPVSSTRIHNLLAEGDVVRATRLLGHRPSASGPIESGAQRGRVLGFPTANVDIPAWQALPANGVYAVWAKLVGESVEQTGWSALPGVANVGIRPTFDAGARSLEVYLLDFEGDIYGKRLRVEFVERLRPEQRFPSPEALMAQIQQDVEMARRILRTCQTTQSA